MSEEKIVTACVLVIGNEILSGRTQDKNINYLAKGLNEIGVRLREVRVIPDVAEVIVATVRECKAAFDYVFTTGGIGPTHDDITAAAVAKALGREFGRNAEAEAVLRGHYRPEEITEARLSMADMPEGAELIDNPVSRAPGFRIENVFVLPGVPRIMQAMFDGLRHGLAGGQPVRSVTIAAYLPEGLMARPAARAADHSFHMICAPLPSGLQRSLVDTGAAPRSGGCLGQCCV